MSNISIVTDSTADLSREQIERYQITVVPINVIIGDETYRDGVDLPVERFYERLVSETEVVPRTSQPAIGIFAEAYKRLTEAGKDVLSLHISGRLSGTLNSAHAARELVDGRVEVVDTLTASQGVGRTVLVAAEAARRGMEMPDVLSVVKTSVQRTFSVFAVDTLEYLRRNGRIGRAAALLGSLLKLKPILYADDEGMVAPYGKVRGRSKVIPRLIEAVHEQLPQGTAINLSVVHSGAEKAAESLLKELRRTYTVVEEHVGMVGPAIGAHVGPGALAVMCQPSFENLLNITFDSEQAVSF